MSKTVNGWPAPPPRLRTFQVTDRTRLTLRDGSAGFLLAHLARRFDRELEDIDWNYLNGQLDDWGYAMRPVRGYVSNLSNHAGGVACDLNATEHPLGVDHTFTQAEENKVNHILKMYDGNIRWGQNYSGRVDPMHFELVRDLAAAEKTARRLMDTTKNGKWLVEHNPGLRKFILS